MDDFENYLKLYFKSDFSFREITEKKILDHIFIIKVQFIAYNFHLITPPNAEIFEISISGDKFITIGFKGWKNDLPVFQHRIKLLTNKS